MGRSNKSRFQEYMRGRSKILDNVSVDDILKMGKKVHEEAQKAPEGVWGMSTPFNIAEDVNKMQQELAKQMYGDPSKYSVIFPPERLVLSESAATQFMAMEKGMGNDKNDVIRVRDQDSGSVVYGRLAEGVIVEVGTLLVDGDGGLRPISYKEKGLDAHLPLLGIDKMLKELDELNTVENNFGKIPS